MMGYLTLTELPYGVMLVTNDGLPYSNRGAEDRSPSLIQGS